MNGHREVVTLTEDGPVARDLRARWPSAPTGSRRPSPRWASSRRPRGARSLEHPAAPGGLPRPCPCMGAVLHTLNIRLFPEQLAYVVNHAQDRVMLVDDSLVPSPRARAWTTSRRSSTSS